MTAAPVLELAGFGVAFGSRVVLDDVSFAVPSAECTVLLGPSGTGKSTLLRTVAGFNRALPRLRTWGRVRYRSAPCGEGNQPALVMQNSRLLMANVLENLVCALPARAELTQRMQVDAVRPLLAACGQEALLAQLARPVVELPLGTQRIVAILREAVAAPALLMVDEPTANLPPDQGGEVLRVLQAVARERAVLVVLHRLDEACAIADTTVLVAGGVVQEAGPAAAFFARPASESGRLFLATGSCPEPAREIETPTEPAALEPLPSLAPAAGPAQASARAYASAARGPRGFVWLLPGQLAGTPWPGVVHGASYDLQALSAVGITDLISLTEEPFDAESAARWGIRRMASPMPDMHPPTREQAIALCRAIDGMLQAGRVVAVHCRAGLGRTGTVLAAYWLWRARGGLAAVRALEDVRRLEPGWVQSEAQVRFLEEFALVVAQPGAMHPGIHDPEEAPDVALPLHSQTTFRPKEGYIE